MYSPLLLRIISPRPALEPLSTTTPSEFNFIQSSRGGCQPIPVKKVLKVSIRRDCQLQIVYLDQFIASGFNLLADIFKNVWTILKNVFVPSSPNTVQSNNKGYYNFLMRSPICNYVQIHPSSSSSTKIVSRLQQNCVPYLSCIIAIPQSIYNSFRFSIA